MVRCLRFAVVLYALIDLSACTTSVVQPSGSSTVTSPALSSPANGALIPNANQPVVLTIANAIVTQSGAATYTFEVATDSAFTLKVATKTAPAGANGSTSVTLDPLAGGLLYYWHARASTTDSTGVFSAASKFSIGAAVVLQPPAPVSPLSGGASSTRPTLTLTNSTHTGSTGAIVYRFEISTSAAFSPVVNSGTVPEGNGQTSYTPSVDVPTGTLYWHAQAFDATNNVSSTFSTPQSFATNPTTIDLTTVNFQRFVNITNWKVTDQITSIDQDGADGHMCINHIKSGVWPTSDFFGDPNTQVEGNQWYMAFINGVWYAGAGEYLRPSQVCKAGQYTEAIGPDGTWGGPMDTWQPKPGELVGYMISTPARNYPDSKTVDERSPVVLQPWHDSRFNAASLPIKRSGRQ
jgi:hypothetical protein